MTMIWERSGEAYYAAVAGPDGQLLVRLIVGPDKDRWRWIVWRTGEDRGNTHRGVADTVQDAMREAELVTFI
jgi:hypothetical protein